jgi:hypothetical protein
MLEVELVDHVLADARLLLLRLEDDDTLASVASRLLENMRLWRDRTGARRWGAERARRAQRGQLRAPRGEVAPSADAGQWSRAGHQARRPPAWPPRAATSGRVSRSAQPGKR